MVLALSLIVAGCSNDEDKLRSDIRSIEKELKEVEGELETTEEELKEVEGELETTEKDLQSAQNELRNREAAAVSATARKIFNAIERDRDFESANYLRLTKGVRGPTTIRPDLTIVVTDGIDPDSGGIEKAPIAIGGSTTNLYAPPDDIPARSLPSLAGWKGREHISEHPDDRTTCVFHAGCLPGITDHLVLYANQKMDSDTQFMVYGYWVRDFDSGDENWFDVRPLVKIGGALPPSNNAVAMVKTGTATYNGGAAGMYSLYRPDTTSSSSGHWTANAMLEANFNNQNVSGQLTGFMSEGQAMNWTVDLQTSGTITNVNPTNIRGRVSSRGGGFVTDGSTHGFSNPENGTIWTIGTGAADPAGSWYGDFWAANDVDNLDNTLANNPVPETATGVFWAEHGEIGRMTGAFGVEKVNDN